MRRGFWGLGGGQRLRWSWGRRSIFLRAFGRGSFLWVDSDLIDGYSCAPDCGVANAGTACRAPTLGRNIDIVASWGAASSAPTDWRLLGRLFSGLAR